MAYHRYHGLDTRIVRIFSIYRPRMRLRDGRAISALDEHSVREVQAFSRAIHGGARGNPESDGCLSSPP